MQTDEKAVQTVAYQDEKATPPTPSGAVSGQQRSSPLAVAEQSGAVETEEQPTTTPAPHKKSTEKKDKKGTDPPSPSGEDTKAHCNEIINLNTCSLDESIVKKANPPCAKCPLRDRPYVPGWGDEGRGSEYYNKLSGTSRQWGDICYYFGYIEGSRELIMVDRDEVPSKLLEGDKAADARVKVAQQVKLLAFKAKIKLDDISTFVGIATRNFQYYCVGDKVPNEEHYQALLKLQEGLSSGKITEENIAGGSSPGSPLGHPRITLDHPRPAKVTPVTPTPPKVSDKKRVKKGKGAPSQDKADSTPDAKGGTTKAHCNEILNFKHVTLDDESIVKKANPPCAKCPLRDRPYVPGWGDEGRGSEYYNKLSGTSRQWGDICYYFGYIEGGRELIMIGRDDVPKKLLEEERTSDARVKVAQQVKLLATRAGMSVASIAEYLDVTRKSLYDWFVGEKLPKDEHFEMLLDLKQALESGEIAEEIIAVSGIHRGEEQVKAVYTEIENPAKITPVTPAPPEVKNKKRAKKGKGGLSPSEGDTNPHCTEFVFNEHVINEHVILDDEAIVKKANPACAKCPLRDRTYVPGWGGGGRGGVSFFDDRTEQRG